MSSEAPPQANAGATTFDPPGFSVVFLHGFLGSGDEWHEIRQTLEQLGIDCHAPDLPGHGLPAANLPEHADFASINDWLTRYLRQHQIQRYLLVGYSLGGRLALYHAAQQPEGLIGLLLESCHPGLDDEQSRRQRHNADLSWSKRFARDPIEQVLRRWYRQPVFASLNQQQRRAMVARRCHAWGNTLATMLSALSLAKQPDLRPWLTTTRLPIHYVCGGRDEKFADIGRELAAQCPTLTLHLINDAGHNVHHADPLQFSQILQHAIQVISNAHD